MLDMLAPTDAYYRQIQGASKQALDAAFGAAQDRIGAQFSPTMRLAQARLGANPLLADSGYANRLNRQIQTSAYGDLSRAYGDAAAGQAQGQLDALQRLLQARMGAASQLYGGIQQKQGIGSQIAGFGGQLLGGIGGAYLGGYFGQKGKAAAG